MKIIDMRVRAPFGAYTRGCNLFSPALDSIVSQRLPKCKADPSALEGSMEMLIQEIENSDIEKIVVPVRKAIDGNNTELVDLINRYPDKIVGMAGIDAVNIPASIAEIEQYVVNGPCQGIIMEPGQDKSPWFANTPKVFAVYEYCEAHNIPIFMTFGGIMSDLRYYDPKILDDICIAFPKLKLGLAHGGWPYVTEVCQIALNRGNVYLAPDFYMIESPGMQDYVMAANCLLKERMMFASAYPLMPIKGAAEYYMNCGVREDCLPYLMHDNAVEFLGLK